MLDEWQCPDPLAKVIFKIEEDKAKASAGEV